PVMALYELFFCLGWYFYRRSDLLHVLAPRWKVVLILGIAVSQLGSVGVTMHYVGGSWARENVVMLKWTTSFVTSLTMALSVIGWLGCFVRWFRRPSKTAHYLADASYWIYLTHLPLVVALQIGFSQWKLPWWAQLPLLNVVAFAILLSSYHW